MRFTSQRGNQKWFSVCEVKKMKLYYLEDKKQQAQVVISPIGGQVISFVKDGKEIIYLQRTIEAKRRGGIPICFPFFGPPKQRFATIPQHGWLRDQELYTAYEGEQVVVFQGDNEERNTKSYSWLLRYSVDIQLTDRSLVLLLRVQRLEDKIKEDAPINPAFHPYFSKLGRRAIKIGEEETENFNKDAKIVRLNGKKELTINLGQKKVKMVLEGDFGEESCVTLWTDSEQYFCVEPSLTHPDDFDTQNGKYLKQGEFLTLVCELLVLP